MQATFSKNVSQKTLNLIYYSCNLYRCSNQREWSFLKGLKTKTKKSSKQEKEMKVSALFFKRVGNLIFVTDFLSFHVILEVLCVVIHASCYFLNNFQHFTRLFWILGEEKLKGSKATTRFSFHFDFAFQLCFFLYHQK